MIKDQNKKVKIFLLAVLLLLTSNIFSQDPNFYIYLCFGQSNMEGQGTIETQDKIVDSRFHVMQAVDCSNLGRMKGSWYTAIPPLTRCWSGLSPADYFGRMMVENLPDSIRIGVINVSVAGCKIELFDKENYQNYVSGVTEDWLKNIINEYNGNPYAYLVELAQLAQKEGVIKGILLHQGESNTSDSKWPTKVKGVYDNLINDLQLSSDSVPLLAGEVVHADQGGKCASMNSIIDKLPQTIPNSYVISSSGCTAATDSLHFNSAGYRKIGIRYAIKMLSLLGYEVAEPGEPIPVAIYFEPECANVGNDWEIISYEGASNESIVSSAPGLVNRSKSSIGNEDLIEFSFSINETDTYDLYARINCATTSSDSYWVRMDGADYISVDGLITNGWQWKKLNSYDLMKGDHKLSIAYREEGANLDKICISNFTKGPEEMGDTAINQCIPNISTVGVNLLEINEGYGLGQNYPNPFYDKTSISFEIKNSTFVSLKVFDMLGTEIKELAGKIYNSGKHTLELNNLKLSKGNYLYTIKTDKYSATRKMIKLTD